MKKLLVGAVVVSGLVGTCIVASAQDSRSFSKGSGVPSLLGIGGFQGGQPAISIGSSAPPITWGPPVSGSSTTPTSNVPSNVPPGDQSSQSWGDNNVGGKHSKGSSVPPLLGIGSFPGRHLPLIGIGTNGFRNINDGVFKPE